MRTWTRSSSTRKLRKLPRRRKLQPHPTWRRKLLQRRNPQLHLSCVLHPPCVLQTRDSCHLSLQPGTQLISLLNLPTVACAVSGVGGMISASSVSKNTATLATPSCTTTGSKPLERSGTNTPNAVATCLLRLTFSEQRRTVHVSLLPQPSKQLVKKKFAKNRLQPSLPKGMYHQRNRGNQP